MTTAHWGPEIVDCFMYLARAHLALGNIEMAKTKALQAIALNTNFRECLRFMASLSGPETRRSGIAGPTVPPMKESSLCEETKNACKSTKQFIMARGTSPSIATEIDS